MKNLIKTIIAVSLLAAISVSLFADPVQRGQNKNQALTVVEALQTSFRNISAEMLPSVVEVDVTETNTVQNHMRSIPFFFFGEPEDEGSDRGKREYETKGLGSGVIVRRE